MTDGETDIGTIMNKQTDAHTKNTVPLGGALKKLKIQVNKSGYFSFVLNSLT